MAKTSDYTINNTYQGGYSSLKPGYGENFTGVRANAGSFGITTNPQTANIIKDASTKLSSGVKHIELTLISPKIFDAVPQQQLKELNKLSKLIGIDVSVHGPVIDTTGMTQTGWSEVDRESQERKIFQTLERSQDVRPDGNVHVIFHSAEGIHGSEWKELNGEEGRKARRLVIVDKESGQMSAFEYEKDFYPGGKGGKIISQERTPEKRINDVNETKWNNSINQIVMNKERFDEILAQNEFQIRHILSDRDAMEKIIKGQFNDLTQTQVQAYLKYNDAQTYLGEINKSAMNVFSNAYKLATDEQKKKLFEISKEYGKDIENSRGDVLNQSLAMKKLLYNLKDDSLAPRQIVPIEEFAVEKSSQTFGNAAFQAYKKFGEKAPVMCIENPPAGFGLSTGEDLRNLVKASRNQFVENLVEKEGKGRREAEKIAEKLIGATWDVGHINMLRGQGFKEQDIIKETEKIAPYLKHVHLSDNFGFEHTELPMGMGNVPLKEMMGKLGEKGFEAKKIIEAGDWWQHMQTPPIKETFEAFGSSFYTSGAGPQWNQSLGLYQGYSEGLVGNWLPQTNYETFGTTFSRLPTEFGGVVGGGTGGRMGGGRE
ncbi:MAG: TIM barrel protein [Candidatus Pacearchaeota archaeon]|jgi:hypothetical protein